MKNTTTLLKGLIVCGITLAMAGSLAAQVASPGTAKVVRIKGNARYTTGNNVYLPLKVGTVLKPGTTVQTAANSYVDIVLGEGGGALGDLGPVMGSSSAVASSPPATPAVYQPKVEQNIVRLYENTALGIDKLTTMDTGADVVTETQLDLKAGRILGNVKKMSAASKYEVKIPNGVAGIRGTVYTLSADGVVKVLVGSVVVAYVAPDGTVVTQVVNGGFQFDARTGQVTPISDFDRQEMVRAAKEARIGPNTPATTFVVDHTIYFVSPTRGHNGNGENP
jgi:hypothetical protein